MSCEGQRYDLDEQLGKTLVELYEIKHSTITSYHPKTNGLVEINNLYILQALRDLCTGLQDDLQGIVMAYRSSPATQSPNISQFSSCIARRCVFK